MNLLETEKGFRGLPGKTKTAALRAEEKVASLIESGMTRAEMTERRRYFEIRNIRLHVSLSRRETCFSGCVDHYFRNRLIERRAETAGEVLALSLAMMKI